MSVIWDGISRSAGALALALLLGACLPGGGGGPGSAKPGEANVLTGDAIEVTALGDAPAAGESPVNTAPAAAALADPAAALAADAAAPVTTAEPAVAGEAPPVTAAAGELPEPVPPVVPEVVKSEAQLACEKDKGAWSDTGGGFTSCVYPTKDNGKMCRKSTECDGYCLARSGTCAPFRPLFGCHEVLDDMGRRMTECLQ